MLRLAPCQPTTYRLVQTRMFALKGGERQALLRRVPTWREAPDRDAICKDFAFANFREAFAFMTAVAGEAERMDHHPEWCNVYNRVNVVLTTHDANGVTPKDVALAEYMDTAQVDVAEGRRPPFCP
eukprot:EG_transcript_30862